MRSNKTRSTLAALAAALAITSFALSTPALAATSQNPIVLHEAIILTSTSGMYINMTSGSPSIVGPASGTMTLQVGAAGPPGYVLTLSSGSVNLSGEHVPFLTGSAYMNSAETFIRGFGIVAPSTVSNKNIGGTFTFDAFPIGPSVRNLPPLDFQFLVIHLHLGAAQYLVLLHVTTAVTV